MDEMGAVAGWYEEVGVDEWGEFCAAEEWSDGVKELQVEIGKVEFSALWAGVDRRLWA